MRQLLQPYPSVEQSGGLGEPLGLEARLRQEKKHLEDRLAKINSALDALEMRPEEQQQRMKHMRQLIVGHNIYSWASNLLRTIASI